ncbi:hypothetical protein [Micromonospora sp. NPDC049497]|uniref:hypothetical protein n=1 Tax=Micromonospora sp. NPDC049497 TaxID=3364273 RepID=UPI00378D41A5
MGDPLPAATPAAVLEVTDDGPGLPADQAVRVFERLYPAPTGRGAAVDGPAGGARGGGARGGGAAPPAATATPATTGTVTDIDGTVMKIRRESGEVVTVQTDDGTQVRLPGALKDLQAGDTVVVTGNMQSGEISAATITQQK